ncbi:GGDEF domain-containing protein [Neobacillus drentensis]
MTRNKENEKKLEYLSNIDGLTSLFNRRYFDHMLHYYWESPSHCHYPLSVILFDVDYFKSYNDYYGHVLGDQCLINISTRIKGLLDSYEAVCARYGGEEFAVILPQRESHEAYLIAEKIRFEIEQLHIPHQMSNISEWVTMSFGVASVIPNESLNSKELLELADQALYEAKKCGRNRVFRFEETLVLSK